MTLSPEQLGRPLKVLKRIQETPDAVSLVLEIPVELKSQFHYQAGQFVTFFLAIDGQPLNRSYSLSTSPMVDSQFQVTVKKVSGGRGSTYLTERVREGDSLLTSPPAGQFFKPLLSDSGAHYLLFAAGSGITPVFSILKTVLTASTKNQVTLVYCNRNEDSIIYKFDLHQWEQKYPTQLKVMHTLSKPSPAWTGAKGRITSQMVADAVHRSRGTEPRQAYLCGPTEFMTTIRQELSRLGLGLEQIRTEDFGLSVHKGAVQEEVSWTLIGPQTTSEEPEQLVVELNGESHELSAKAGQSVLETLLEAGIQAPYSCMDGACMACMAKIQAGRVYQEDPGILTDDNVRNCEALTCQAKPLSRIVKLTFDDL